MGSLEVSSGSSPCEFLELLLMGVQLLACPSRQHWDSSVGWCHVPIVCPQPTPPFPAFIPKEVHPLRSGVLFCYMTLKLVLGLPFPHGAGFSGGPSPTVLLVSSEVFACLSACPSISSSRGNRLVLGSALRWALKLPYPRTQLGLIREPRAAMLVQMGWFQALGTLD